MSYSKITLTQVLAFLEKKEEINKPTLLVNSNGNLTTFFTYKGNLKEIFKYEMEMRLHPENKKKIDDEMHSTIEIGMSRGYWTVLDMGKSPEFKPIEFFKNFSWYEENMFLPQNIHDKSYCLKHNILRKESDFDAMGNKGFLEINEQFKLLFLTECPEEKIKELIDNCQIDFNVIIVV